jgi:hypothetical protein
MSLPGLMVAVIVSVPLEKTGVPPFVFCHFVVLSEVPEKSSKNSKTLFPSCSDDWDAEGLP